MNHFFFILKYRWHLIIARNCQISIKIRIRIVLWIPILKLHFTLYTRQPPNFVRIRKRLQKLLCLRTGHTCRQADGPSDGNLKMLVLSSRIYKHVFSSNEENFLFSYDYNTLCFNILCMWCESQKNLIARLLDRWSNKWLKKSIALI